jgi:hypothetical protein
MKVKQWIDTHTHISGGANVTVKEIIAGFESFFAKEPIELKLIASLGNGWLEGLNEPGNALKLHTMLTEIIQAFPGKLYGGCMTNSNHLDESLALMDKCLGEWGYVQHGELVTYLHNYNMNCDKTKCLVKKAIEYDVPIHVHISTSNAKPQGHYASGEEELNDMLDLVEKVPGGRYVFTHGIGAPQISPPVIDTYLAMIDKRYGKWPDNMWIEIIHFHAAGVKSALSYIPIDKILCGTDWNTGGGLPFHAYGTSFMGADAELPVPYPQNIDSLVKFLSQAGVSETDISKIGYQNALSLYDLPDAKKTVNYSCLSSSQQSLLKATA